MMERVFTARDLASLDRVQKMNLAQSLPGFKTANLIGTVNNTGITNLGIFSSVFHLGSNPPLLGFKMRPVHVQRDTYQNILETGVFTLNYISREMLPRAHWTSEKFPPEVSEFEACGFTPVFEPEFPAPFVAESPVQIGCRYVESQEIRANGVIIMVGEVVHIRLMEGILEEDGHLNMEKAGALAISGPDRYHTTEFLMELPYGMPKPDQ